MRQAKEIAVDWLFEHPGVEAPKPDAVLGIANGRIASVATSCRRGRRQRAALPALVNAHDHGRCFRPIACGIGDQHLECWLSMLGHMPAVDLYTQSVVAFGRMALSGIASVAQVHIPGDEDPVAEAEAVAKAARDVGVRLAYAAPIVDTNAFVYGGTSAIQRHHCPSNWNIVQYWDGRPTTAEAQIEAVDAIAQACAGPLVNVQYGPAGPQWVTEKGWHLLARRAADTGRRIHTHLLETKTQRQWADKHYPDGLLGFLDSVGVLSPQLTVAHCVWLTEDEIRLLADRNVAVVINSSSNLRLKSGIAPVRSLLEAGLSIGMGLDGMAFNDDEDALFELRLLAGLHSRFGLEGAGIAESQAWWAATGGGRRTIDNSEASGLLKEGYDADIMVLDLEAMSEDAIPELADPLQLIMTRSRKAHVSDLYVAGRHVVCEGRLAGVDLEAAEREVVDAARSQAADLLKDRDLLLHHRDTVRSYYQSGHHLYRRDGS